MRQHVDRGLPISSILPPPDLTPATSIPPPTDTSKPPDSGAQEDPDWRQKRRRSWAKLISKTWHDDPEICRACGKTMQIVAAIAPEQEDVIERILRHLQLWDPPWKRQRQARGPPPSSRAGGIVTPASRESIDPINDVDLNDDLNAIDFIPPEDDDTQV